MRGRDGGWSGSIVCSNVVYLWGKVAMYYRYLASLELLHYARSRRWFSLARNKPHTQTCLKNGFFRFKSALHTLLLCRGLQNLTILYYSEPPNKGHYGANHTVPRTSLPQRSNSTQVPL